MKAPEKIYINGVQARFAGFRVCDGGDFEYIRADLNEQLQQENLELKDELAKLQLDNHNLIADTYQLEQRVPDNKPIAQIAVNQSGQISIQSPDGSYFDVSKYVNTELYAEPQPTNAIKAEAAFLLERLECFESELDDKAYREWNGHVAPSMARLKMALQPPQKQREGNSHE